jgi:signal transduction histidine kinase
MTTDTTTTTNRTNAIEAAKARAAELKAAVAPQEGPRPAPVDQLRANVDSMAGSGDGHRVTVPETGDELSRLATTMNELLDRIDLQRSAQRQFVADASHELKSPVANLRVLAETSDRPADEHAWQVLRSSMVGEAERLRSMVDDLLFLARSDEEALTSSDAIGVTANRHDVVHLDDVLFDEAERATAAAPEGVHIDASGVVPASVRGDGAALSRLARNLIENAARHATSRVQVAVESGEATVRVHIDDDGPGVHEGDRERVFERFTRLDSDRARASGGTGLGLAIVARIAAIHGGSVTISTSDINGARFTLTLPA